MKKGLIGGNGNVFFGYIQEDRTQVLSCDKCLVLPKPLLLAYFGLIEKRHPDEFGRRLNLAKAKFLL